MNLVDRVKCYTPTVGTGTISLGSPVTDAINGDFQSFASAGAVDGDTYSYLLIDGHNWEYGYGVYNAISQTLTRSPIQSILGTSLISLSGSAIVACVLLAEEINNISGKVITDITTGASPITLTEPFSDIYVITSGGTGGEEDIILPAYAVAVEANIQKQVIFLYQTQTGSSDKPTLKYTTSGPTVVAVDLSGITGGGSFIGPTMFAVVSDEQFWAPIINSWNSAYTLNYMKGQFSVAWGSSAQALGNYSTAWGGYTTAGSTNDTAWGSFSVATGGWSTAWGVGSSASGVGATSWGNSAGASNSYATAWGFYTTASLSYATAWGNYTTASGLQSTAFGAGTTASGTSSVAYGAGSQATGLVATAWGETDGTNVPVASGEASTAFGQGTQAQGLASTAWGVTNTAAGTEATVWGDNNTAGTNAPTVGDTAWGTYCSATGGYSTAQGYHTIASGLTSTAEGYSTTSSGKASHSWGNGCIASGPQSFAGGYSCTASGQQAFTIGSSLNATNFQTVAFGTNNIASGVQAVVFGANNSSGGQQSFVFGVNNTATGDYSTVFGKTANDNGITGALIIGIQNFESLGDNQDGTYFLANKTVDATATVLTADFSAPAAVNQVALQDNATFKCRVTVCGKVVGGTDYMSTEIDVIIGRGTGAASTAILTTTPTTPAVINHYYTSGASSWTVTLSADTTNGALTVTVTGTAATNINWQAKVTTSEIIG